MKTKRIDYNITNDPQFLDDQNFITVELSSELAKFHQLALDGRKSSIPKLLEAIEKYPNNPQLKNYLSVLYCQLEETQKMYDVNKWIIAEHPNYLFGKLNLANEYYLRQEYEKMPEVLGHLMELKSLYPERNTFHVNEVTSFFKCTILYFIAIGNIQQAEIRYDLMKEIAPDSPDTEMVLHHLFAARMKAGQKRYEEEQKNRISVTVNSQEVNSIKEPPKFYHQEINTLYCNGLYIEKEKIKKILILPRQTLIHDLELVLEDSIKRYSYFQRTVQDEGWNEERLNFVIHAIYILGELKASESNNILFNVLSQSNEYLELYFGDFIAGMVWEPIFKMATNNFQEWKEFMYRPGIDTYAKSNFPDAIEQIALHYPESRKEAINWFNDVIEFYLNSTLDQNVIDSDLIALIICNVIEIDGDELLPKIEKLFDKGLVSIGICGSWIEVKEAFSQHNIYDKRKDVLSIFDRYKNITSTWAGYNEDEKYTKFDVSDKLDSHLKPIKAKRKIGRNEKCPCGSGKKYKKCCLNK